MSSLSTSISLSKRIAAAPQISKSGNVNILEKGDDNIRELVAYLPYLFEFVAYEYTPNNAIGQYEGLAAILLAMEHLNTGNGTIVPELNGINETCPLKFTTDSFDTMLQQRVAVDHIITMTDRNRTQGLSPTAILGAASSGISIPTSIISGLRGFPQICAISTSAALDDKSQYKLFGRTIPNDDGTAVPLIEKLSSWNVKYLAVLHSDDPYGNAFADGIRGVAQRDAPDLRVETREISSRADGYAISDVIRLLKDTEFTYFFAVITEPVMIDKIMTEAYEQGIAGTGRHTWLFSDSFGSTAIGRDFKIGSPLEKAYRGTGLLSAVGGIPGLDAYDKLANSIQQLRENEEDLSYLNARLPRDYPGGKIVDHSIITGQDAFLKSPGLVGPFLYDAVVGLGLASCGLLETSGNEEYFSGEELFEALRLNTTFHGASGLVLLDPYTGTREPRSALFSLTNFVDNDDASQGDIVQFKGVDTHLFESGKWLKALEPYTFNDGTDRIPSDLPILVVNPNYLNTGLRAVGFTLSGIVVALALGSSFWTYHYSEKRVVRSSQPIFLHLISAGTMLMGLSIIPLTIDLGVTDQKGADVACMAFPWLLATGFSLTFSALFTKTYRINQIMKSAARFKRIKVEAVDVIKPMVVLLVINTIVLTVWTIVDPLQRETVSVETDAFLRDVETYGICESDHAAIFLAILSFINLGSLLVALGQSYKSRKISTELQESSYIFLAMALILLVSFIGIPVIVIARNDVSAYYYVVAGLVFVVSASILLLMFIPKVDAVRRKMPMGTRGTFSTKRRSDVSSTSSEGGEGIQILNAPAEQKKLYKEIAELEKKNRELMRLLSEKESKKDSENCESLASFSEDDGGRTSNSVTENDHAPVFGDSEVLKKEDNALGRSDSISMGTGNWSDHDKTVVTIHGKDV